MTKILAVRRDKLGDTLLCLPALRCLRENLSSSELFFWGNPAYEDLLQPWFQSQNIQWVSNPKDSFFDFGLIFYCTGREFKKYLQGRLGYSFGLYSKFWSFLKLDSGVRQRRSLGLMPESQYNIQLAYEFLEECFTMAKKPNKEPIILPPHFEAQERVTLRLKALGAEPPYGIFHVGSGGSGKNLSPGRYARILQSIKQATNLQILLTQGPNDHAIVRAVHEETKIPIVSGMSLLELAELYRRAEWVVAPGTGPLHLAHFVGTKTYGLFAPFASETYKRWNPVGGKETATALTPLVECPGTKKCLGKRCPAYDCLESYPWERALSDAMARRFEA